MNLESSRVTIEQVHGTIRKFSLTCSRHPHPSACVAGVGAGLFMADPYLDVLARLHMTLADICLAMNQKSLFEGAVFFDFRASNGAFLFFLLLFQVEVDRVGFYLVQTLSSREVDSKEFQAPFWVIWQIHPSRLYNYRFSHALNAFSPLRSLPLFALPPLFSLSQFSHRLVPLPFAMPLNPYSTPLMTLLHLHSWYHIVGM